MSGYTYFDNIDSPTKAYILGLVIYNIKLNEPEKIIVEIIIDNDNIKDIYNELNKIGDCIYISDNTLYTSITGVHILKKIKEYTSITNFTSICDSSIQDIIDKLDDIKSKQAFVKAYIERFGNIITENNESSLYVTFYLDKNTDVIKNMFNVPFCIRRNFNLNIAIYDDVNIIDLMGIIYKDNIYTNTRLYKWYHNIINDINCDNKKIQVFKTDDNAVIPSKNRISDAGYDITIIKEAKKFNEKTTLYDTCIKLNIPNGYYVEIVPRSSLSKSGYMLANSVGIIDQSYRGNIFVALTKINETSDDIKLPFCCCQMIVRKQIYSDIVECFKDFSITNRNEKGYGDASLAPVTTVTL